MALRKCTFCGKDVKMGQGMLYVKKDGTTYWYCSSKCRVNALKLRRDPRKLKWTVHYVKRGKDEG